MQGEGVSVYDIEFVIIDPDFAATRLTAILESAGELGARRLSVCGDDPDRGRLEANFAKLCDLAAGFGMGVDLECMAWRQVSSFPEAVRVVEAAGRPNGGALVDALHLSRTGGSPSDLKAVPSQRIRSAQLCDAPATRRDQPRPSSRKPGPGVSRPVTEICPYVNCSPCCRTMYAFRLRSRWTARRQRRLAPGTSSRRPKPCLRAAGSRICNRRSRFSEEGHASSAPRLRTSHFPTARAGEQ